MFKDEMRALRYNEFCSCYILLVSLFGFLIFATEAAPTDLWRYCNTTSNRTNPKFHENLDSLLSSLTSKAAADKGDGFDKDVKGWGTPDIINGQYICFGNFNASVCEDCVKDAAKEIRSCINQSEAVIWYDECMLLYQNRSYTFDDMYNDGYAFYMWNVDNISDSEMERERFNGLLANLLNDLVSKAANSQSKKFATGQSNFSDGETIYSLVQCVPDLDSSMSCEDCLIRAISEIPLCCAGKRGGRVCYTGCNIRFEVYPFYEITPNSTQPAVSPPTPPVAAVDPPPSGKKGIGSETIIVVVVPVSVALIFLCVGCYFLQMKKRKRHKAILKENFGEESDTLKSLQFNLATIEAATNNFSSENVIGKGGFGEVYKGILPDGQQIAVKRLSKKSGQGSLEFKNEILLIAKLQHRNLVTLLGFCVEDQEKILVYEYVPNKSLDYFLFDSQKRTNLSWSERFKIVGGVGRGILYLHEYSRLKVIHRDLKPSNVLLDNNMNPKISDFGMARMVAIEQNQGSTNRIVGTHGYMSPEYMLLGQFSEKSDVFSFGVMILEIFSGKRNASSDAPHLLSYAWRKWRDETSLEILDPYVEELYSQIEFVRCLQIGLLCVQDSPEDRPTMAKVVSYLSNPSVELPIPREPAFLTHDRIAIESGSSQSTNKSTQFSVNEMSKSELFPR